MSRRISLRDYQADLSERLKNAQVADASGTRLGIQAGDTCWLLELADAGEVVSLPQLLPVPLTRPWLAGVANVRGNLRAIVDFSQFLGGPPVARNDQARVLLVSERFHVNAGLLVNRVLGLRRTEQLTAEESGAAAAAPWVTGAWRDQDDRTWYGLDVAALVGHQDFLQIEL